eukprot:Pgem_evm1s1444
MGWVGRGGVFEAVFDWKLALRIVFERSSLSLEKEKKKEHSATIWILDSSLAGLDSRPQSGPAGLDQQSQFFSSP